MMDANFSWLTMSWFWNLRIVSRLRLPVSLFKWVESLKIMWTLKYSGKQPSQGDKKLDITEVPQRWQNAPPLCPSTPGLSMLGTLNIYWSNSSSVFPQLKPSSTQIIHPKSVVFDSNPTVLDPNLDGGGLIANIMLLRRSWIWNVAFKRHWKFWNLFGRF